MTSQYTLATETWARIFGSYSKRWGALIDSARNEELDFKKLMSEYLGFGFQVIDDWSLLAGLAVGVPIADTSDLAPTIDIVVDAAAEEGRAQILTNLDERTPLGSTELQQVYATTTLGRTIGPSHIRPVITNGRLIVSITGLLDHLTDGVEEEEWREHEQYLGVIYRNDPGGKKIPVVNLHLVRLSGRIPPRGPNFQKGAVQPVPGQAPTQQPPRAAGQQPAV